MHEKHYKVSTETQLVSRGKMEISRPAALIAYRRNAAFLSFCLDVNSLHIRFVDRTATLCDVVAIARVRSSEQLISS